jgi:NarL family two-component system response regulator LiaR
MNVAVVSPRTFTRKGLSVYLTGTPGVRHVAEFESALENLESLRRKPPHVVILDVVNADSDLVVAERLKKQFPASRILLLTEGNDDELEVRALRAGSHGCISRRCGPRELARAVATVAKGEFWVSHRIATSLLQGVLSAKGRNGT